jgi:DNA-binding NtrC family response regulator
MPGTSGVEVLKLFRQTDSNIPIIMVTANSEIRIAEECLKEGAFSYVPKPFNLIYMDHMAALATEQSRKRGQAGRPPEGPAGSPPKR